MFSQFALRPTAIGMSLFGAQSNRKPRLKTSPLRNRWDVLRHLPAKAVQMGNFPSFSDYFPGRKLARIKERNHAKDLGKQKK